MWTGTHQLVPKKTHRSHATHPSSGLFLVTTHELSSGSLLLHIVLLDISLIYFKVKENMAVCDAMCGPSPLPEGTNGANLVPTVQWDCCILYMTFPKGLSR